MGGRSRGFRGAVAVLALLLGGAALAQCSRGPGTASVTLPDFLAVYYAEFRSLLEEDAALFYGGVCVTAVGGEWTVLAESVRLEEISGDIRVVAPEPTLYLGEWRIEGELLTANVNSLTLVGAALFGPGAEGHAQLLEVDVSSGGMLLTGVSLAGSAFAVKGEMAVLEGSQLRFEEAGVTTCIGVERVPFEVTSEVAVLNLEEREVSLSDGQFRLGRLLVPLREALTVSEASFAEFEFPLRVEQVEGGPERPGSGRSIRVVGIPMVPGVNLTVGGTGLEAGRRKGLVALVRAADELVEPKEAGMGAREPVGTVAATFGVEAGAPYVDAAVTRTLAQGVSGELSVLSGAAPAKSARHEGRVALRAQAPLQLGVNAPAATTILSGEVFAAVTAATPGAAQPVATVVGPRLGAAVNSRTSWRAGANSFGLAAGGEFTYYPHNAGVKGLGGGSAAQWGVQLLPSWRYSRAPFTLSAQYEAVFTNEASPFGTAVDRLTRQQRLQASARVAGPLGLPASEPLGRALTGAAGARIQHDFPGGATPGLKRITLDGELVLTSGAWRYSANATAELAGLLATTGRDPVVELRLAALRPGWPVLFGEEESALVPEGSFEAAVTLARSLRASAPPLSSLELMAAVPLTFERLELRPLVALEFAGALSGEAWPTFGGYGLDVTFITCCGSFTVGALSRQGELAVSVSVDLERRPRRAGSAGGR